MEKDSNNLPLLTCYLCYYRVHKKCFGKLLSVKGPKNILPDNYFKCERCHYRLANTKEPYCKKRNATIVLK